MREIDYSLVEEKRPSFYSSMKYWGKKPHNIWRSYIENYTPNSGFFLDPFSGSAIGAFEGVRAGKKSIAFDINPLTSFIIESYCTIFDNELFINTAKQIVNEIEQDSTYKKLYEYRSDFEGYYIQNIKRENNSIYEVCLEQNGGINRLCVPANDEDYNSVLFSNSIKITGLYPQSDISKLSSVSDSFVKNIGSDFSSLYTRRNLWVLSEIFNKIVVLDNKDLVKQLLFCFIQIVHLSSKMCIPRSKCSNRDFSTSWGRPSYIYSKKTMEMNPLILFKNTCFGKKSMCKNYQDFNIYFNNKVPTIKDVNRFNFNSDDNVDIWYGVIDAKHLGNSLPKKTIDFVLTDPPYGGLIQYLDLSSIWLSWLELYDDKYHPNFIEEITINKTKTDLDFYSDMVRSLEEIKEVLKDDGKLVLTFNNNDSNVWNLFLNAIWDSGFAVDNSIYQQNRRTGESNVSNRYGTSATDFYVLCHKNKHPQAVEKRKYCVSEIVDVIRKILLDRNEPTPYQVLLNSFNSLNIVNRYTYGFENFDLEKILNDNDSVFVCFENSNNKIGKYWWLVGVEFDPVSNDTLRNRVAAFVLSLFESQKSFEDNSLILAVFREFKGDLTPELTYIYDIIKTIANKKGDLWVKKQIQ